MATISSVSRDNLVFVGRFQPLHEGHLEVMLRGLREAKKLIVVVGSARAPRSFRNPFTFEERRDMILAAIREVDPRHMDRLRIIPSVDLLYNDEQWIASVQQSVYEHVEQGERVSLIGHAKDSTSYYLDMFPTWGNPVGVQNCRNISATVIRNMVFSNIGEAWLKDCDGHKAGDTPRDRLVPTAVKQFLEDFMRNKPADYKYICDEYNFITEYRKPYLGLPFPPIFTTVDACVVQAGHVLLVQRKTQPGKGLWALPGGFILERETLIEATIRELYEETGLKLHDRIVRGSIKETRVFDEPYRSARGRTITHATLFQLQRRASLPAVRGQESEVEQVRWWPLAEIQPEMMFEDHYSIIGAMTGAINPHI